MQLPNNELVIHSLSKAAEQIIREVKALIYTLETVLNGLFVSYLLVKPFYVTGLPEKEKFLKQKILPLALLLAMLFCRMKKTL